MKHSWKKMDDGSYVLRDYRIVRVITAYRGQRSWSWKFVSHVSYELSQGGVVKFGSDKLKFAKQQAEIWIEKDTKNDIAN